MAGETAPGTDRPLRILLVEDNPDDAEITRFAAVRAVAADITWIADGLAALRALVWAASADGRRGGRRREQGGVDGRLDVQFAGSDGKRRDVSMPYHQG